MDECIGNSTIMYLQAEGFSFRSYGETLKLMKIHDKLSKWSLFTIFAQEGLMYLKRLRVASAYNYSFSAQCTSLLISDYVYFTFRLYT